MVHASSRHKGLLQATHSTNQDLPAPVCVSLPVQPGGVAWHCQSRAALASPGRLPRLPGGMGQLWPQGGQPCATWLLGGSSLAVLSWEQGRESSTTCVEAEPWHEHSTILLFAFSSTGSLQA